MYTKIGQTTMPRRGPNLDLKRAILDRLRRDKTILVWTPNDFLDLGARSGVDKALQRLVLSGDLRQSPAEESRRPAKSLLHRQRRRS